MSVWTERSSPLLVDGELAAGSGAVVFETVNPATEEVLGTAADATSADMDRAIGAARRAFDESSWSTDVALRVRCLRQLGEALRRHTEELRVLTIAEAGAPAFLTHGPQLEGPIADLVWFADLAEGYDWVRAKYPEAARDEDEMEQQHAAPSAKLTGPVSAAMAATNPIFPPNRSTRKLPVPA